MNEKLQGNFSEHELIGGDKWSVEDMAERYNTTPEFLHRVLLPLGLPYEMHGRYAENYEKNRFESVEVMEFDTEKVMEWEMRRKCIGCGKGLPGCGLLPAYRDYLFGRKRSAGLTALYLLCFLLSIYQAVFTPFAIAGYAATAVFTVCLYDQSMRKGRREK